MTSFGNFAASPWYCKVAVRATCLCLPRSRLGGSSAAFSGGHVMLEAQVRAVYHAVLNLPKAKGLKGQRDGRMRYRGPRAEEVTG